MNTDRWRDRGWEPPPPPWAPVIWAGVLVVAVVVALIVVAGHVF